MVYAIAMANSGQASKILLAGFDGYGAEDLRTNEINELLDKYDSLDTKVDLISLMPTQYNIDVVPLFIYKGNA